MSLGVSALTVGAGAILELAVLALPASKEPWTLVAELSAGQVLMGFGPNVGDAANGDLFRFFLRGGLRTALGLGIAAVGAQSILGLTGPQAALVVLLGAAAVVAWFAWIIVDTYESRNAPERWLKRQGTAPAVEASRSILQ